MPYRRPELEPLEDRVAPATNIHVIVGASGAGDQDSAFLANSGQLLFAAPDTTNDTLSTGALASIASTNDIIVQATSAIDFADLGGTLSLQTGLGNSVTFSTATAGGKTISFSNTSNTLATGGGSITFSAGTDLTVANLNTGGGDVSLTAGADVAGNLSAQAILTAASGNITLQATNAAGGTITQTGTASGLVINATATGSVTVDSLSGIAVDLTSKTGAVDSTGTAAVQASAELTVSAATGITLNTLAASLKASNSTSGDISITQSASPAQTLTVTGAGVVNSASTGAITLDNLGSSVTVDAGVGVSTNNGTITLAATDLQLDGTVNSGTARTILENSTAGEQIDVGTNTPGSVGLTQSELNNVTAAVLQIGSSTAGAITISAAIINPATWNLLTLINNGSITEAAAGSLTVPNLRVSSTGPVTLTSANNVGTLAANTTNPFSFNNGTNLLTIGVVDGDIGIVTSGSDIHLIADDMDLGQQVTTGSSTAGIVTLEPFTATETIDLGTNSANHLGLTDPELNEVTASVLRIGSSSFTGNITVSAAINPSSIGALSLITTSSGIISQGSGDTISVDSGMGGLAVQSTSTVTLNEQNDVGRLAAAISGPGNNFNYTDANGFAVSTVDGAVGISTAGALGNTPTLTAGGAVTQDAGASIISDRLQLLGTGSYTLNDPGNDVTQLEANVTGDVSYTNAGFLTLNHFLGAGSGSVTSTSGAVSINTVNGSIDIIDAVSAAATADLTAGAAGNPLTNDGGVTGAGGVTLTADRMTLNAAVNAGSAVAELQPFSGGHAIDLGTNADTTHLGLLQTDLNNVTAGVLRIGNLDTSGSITVTAALTDATTGFNTLSLLTRIGAGISQNSGATLTVTNLNAAGNTGVTLNENNVISTLAGAAASGTFTFTDSTSLTVDNVDSGLGFGSGIITDGQAVSLTVNVLNDSLTVNQQIDTTHNFGFPAPAGANINFSADNMALNNNSPASTINAGTSGIVTVTPFTASNAISVGGADAAGTLGIDDNDLTNVTAMVVRIGSSAQTGTLTVAGSINTHSGYNTLDLIATGSGGAIVENTGSIAVANLALQADAGIGSAVAMDVIGPINVAFLNNTSNNVQISSIGALTIAAVDGVNTSQNNAAGGTVTLAALSPVTFAVNTTSSGTITATTTETAGETTTPLAPPDDDLTVNSGVTVESTGGDVVLTSGDSIVIQSGAVVKSDTGTVTTDFGAGDNDSDAALINNGTISGNLSIISSGDIFLDTLFPGGLNAPGATVSITSTGGGIFDSSDPNDHGDETDVTAANLALQASTGIGTSTDNIITAVSNLVAQTTTGGIFVSNTGDLTVGFSGDPFQGVTVTGTSGDIVLTDAGSVTVTTTGENIQGPANVTVTANGATANIQTGGSQEAIQNIGAGTVTLTAGQDIVLGTLSSFGDVNADQFGNAGTASVFLNAARDITIQGAGGSFLDAFGPTGDVTATAGRNINLLNGNANVFTNGGGTITLTAGAAFTDEPSLFSVSTTLNSPGADITITANTMTIQSVINAGNANVTLKQNPGTENIDLGTNPSPGNLGLAQTDLDNITAGILRIGDTANAGNITVTAAITDATTGWTTLSLLTGGSVSETGSGAMTVTSLAVQAASGIDLTANASAVSNVAASNSLSGGFNLLDSLALTVTTVDTVSGISAAGGILLESSVANTALTVSQPVTTNSGGDIVFTFDNMTLSAGVTATGHRVTLEPFSSGQLIDVGGPDAAGTLGLDSTDLGNVTASTLQVGSSTSGNITVTAPIAPANVTALDLETGGGVTQTAGSTITIPDLAIRAVNAVNLPEANDVEATSLAANVTGAGQSFTFTDANALTIGTVDGLSGITTNGGAITVTASAGDLSVNQNVSAGSANVALTALGTDSFINNNAAISNSGANTITLQANEMALNPGSSVSSPDGGARVILEASTAGRPVNLGPTTDPNGSLNLSNAELNTVTVLGGVFQIGSGIEGDVNLVAGPTLNFIPSTFVATIDTAGTVLGSGTITVFGLRLSAANGVNLPGNNNVTDLSAKVSNGGQSFLFTVSNTGGLDITAVDGVSGITTNNGAVTATAFAAITVDQNVTAGAAPVSLTVDSLEGLLTNNAAITGNSTTLTADRMVLDAGTINVGTGATNIVTLQPFTAGRTIDLGGTGDPTGTLQLSQVELNTITAGIVRVGDFGTSGSITITAPITDVGTGWTTLSLLTEIGAGISQNAGATLTVTNLNAAGNSGVTLTENNVVSALAGAAASGAFSFTDSTNLTVDNVDTGLGSGFGSGIITDGQTVSLTVNVLNDSLTVNQTIDATHNFGTPAPGGANINLTADNMALNNNSPSSTISAGTGGILTLTPFTASNTISVGGADAAGTLGIDDNDLTNVTAKVVRIGSSAQTGAITVGGTINTHAGYSTLDLIATGSGGAITQTTGSIAVGNLALQADAGIGSGGAIQVIGPINVAFRNNTSNNVQITSTGALTITTVDQLDGSAGHNIGNFASGGTETLTASSPMTFAVNDTSSGTITAATVETATETGTPLPPPDDDLTVNSGITVESTGGDVNLTSGDSILIQSGSTIKSDTGAVNLTAGMGDNDNDATLELNGTISSSNGLTLTSPGDICVSGINLPGQTVTITSTGGAILDCGDTPDATDITAATVNLNAATGIGVVGTDVAANDTAVEIQASTLSFSNSTSGDVNIINVSGDLSASGTNSAAGGAINLTVENGNALTVNAGNISSTNNGAAPFTNNITLAADSMTLTGTVNAGAATATLEPFTAGRAIDVGLGTTAGDLNLSNADLAQVTAGTLAIGDTTAADLTVTAGITAPATWSTLSLISGGMVSEQGSSTITVTSLAIQANTGIGTSGAPLQTQVNNLEAQTVTGGVFIANGAASAVTLNVGGVSDALNGVQVTGASGDILLTNNGGINIVTAGDVVLGPGAVEVQAIGATADIQTGGFNILGSTGSGNVTFDAGRDILVGNASDLSFGSIDSAGGAISISAGRNLTVDVASAIAVSGGSNDITAVAGGNITVQQTSSTNGARITNGGTGKIDLTTGVGGIFTLDSGEGGGVVSGGGAITISADDMVINNVITTGASGAIVTLQQATGGAGSTAVNIDLGGGTTAGDLGLSDAELDQVTAGILRIGRTDNAGNITVTAQVSTHLGFDTLSLRTGGGISETTSPNVGAISVAKLAIRAVNAVTMNNANDVSANTLAAAVTGASQGFAFTNSGPLTIGTVDGLTGITTNDGNVLLTFNGVVNLSAPINANGGSATVQGGAGDDTFNVNVTGVTPLSLLGLGGNDTFNVPSSVSAPINIDGGAGTNGLNYNALKAPVGTVPAAITAFGLQTVSYSNLTTTNVNNAGAVDAFYGPNTADRTTALAGLTVAERFVQVLYLNALGRAGSKAEIDGWAAAFGGSSSSNAPMQATIARGIEGSTEGRDHEVKSWYVQYLGRAATGGEEMGWVNMLMAGQTEESVLSQILGSTEFFNHAQTLGFSGTANSQYVQALYELLLHRAGGAAEVASWVSALPATGHRGAALDFLDSGEFRTYQFEGYYNALLHRPADSAGLNGWVGAGIDVFTTRVDFETSSEFFSNG
jgi:hypothetical protein